MRLLHTDTLQSAREKLDFHTMDLEFKSARVKSQDALFRICAADVHAVENIPSFRRSTVDGYAVRAEDTFGASDSNPAFLDVVDHVAIEKQAKVAVHAGQAVAVQTGSMVPDGATAVVMVEYCENYLGDKIVAYKSVSNGENVTQVGEDIGSGECLIPKGKKITAGDIGILAALGIPKIEVYEPLAVTILSTGDELADPMEPLTESKIRDINSYTLAALCAEQGFVVKRCERLKDEEETLYRAVSAAVTDSDIVLLSGGSSKGEKDYTRQVLDAVTGNVFTHGIAIKPGKPTILAYEEKHQTIVAGLPGHPMAAALMFRLVIGDWWERKTGVSQKRAYPAVMSENVSSNQGRETCLLVTLVCGDEGYVATPVYAKSGSISPLSKSDGYLLIDRNKEGLKKGEKVRVITWE